MLLICLRMSLMRERRYLFSRSNRAVLSALWISKPTAITSTIVIAKMSVNNITVPFVQCGIVATV